jgi:hypothetical protein
MIRPATHDDFIAWLGLCKTMHRISPFAEIEPDWVAVGKLFRQCLSSKLGCVLVAEHGGRLTGTLIGLAQQWWWCRKRVASDLTLYSQYPGDGPALLEAFVAWAWSVPTVVHVVCGQSSGIDIERTGAMYLGAGMKQIGGLYYLERPAISQENAA